MLVCTVQLFSLGCLRGSQSSCQKGSTHSFFQLFFVVNSYRDMHAIWQQFILQMFIHKEESMLISCDCNNFFFFFSVASDVDVSGFLAAAFPVKDLSSQFFVVFKQKQADNRDNEWQDQRYSFEIAELQQHCIYYFTLSFELQLQFDISER